MPQYTASTISMVKHEGKCSTNHFRHISVGGMVGGAGRGGGGGYGKTSSRTMGPKRMLSKIPEKLPTL
ncbi:unnamed protein product, partial [Nesidiocoris tenuis]